MLALKNFLSLHKKTKNTETMIGISIKRLTNCSYQDFIFAVVYDENKIFDRIKEFSESFQYPMYSVCVEIDFVEYSLIDYIQLRFPEEKKKFLVTF